MSDARDDMSYANINTLWARALWDAAVTNGVRRVVVSPGSRSTPLAISAHEHPDLDVVLLIDERSAAFFALGQAIADGEPVALVCTSGTAAANYMPAVVEAGLCRAPLVVITADRPPAVRGLGAAQTIDQLHLYGHHVRRFADLPLPSFQPGALKAMQAQVALAVATARSAPHGAVHLNAPYEEPLAPVERDVEATAKLASTLAPAPRVAPGRVRADDAMLAEAARLLSAAERPLLVVGPGAHENGAAALLALAAAKRMPVVADVGSGLRGLAAGDAVVTTHADAFLRHTTLSPDLVVRVGVAPTAKGTLLYLAGRQVPVIALQPDLDGREGDVGAALVVVGDVADAATRLAAMVTPAPAAWGARWAEAESAVGALIDRTEIPDEARAVRAALDAVPAGGRVCLSNSLPVRHADTYGGLRPGLHVHSFRGANGIDGVTSMSLGVARATGAPTLLVTGDLATFHDLGGLAAARHLDGNTVILVLNNDGGGIFSILPVADATPSFEALFGTPHGREFSHAAALFGLDYALCDNALDVGQAVAAGLTRPGVSLVEFTCSRERTAAQQKAFMARAAAAEARA